MTSQFKRNCHYRVYCQVSQGHLAGNVFCHSCTLELLTSFSTLTIGLQSMTDELMYTIPLRDTVAGEALSILCGSNTTLHCGDMGMRSPLANVSVLLSSSTLLRFSIQMASTGPSRTIHMCSPTTKGMRKALTSFW